MDDLSGRQVFHQRAVRDNHRERQVKTLTDLLQIAGRAARCNTEINPAAHDPPDLALIGRTDGARVIGERAVDIADNQCDRLCQDVPPRLRRSKWHCNAQTVCGAAASTSTSSVVQATSAVRGDTCRSMARTSRSGQRLAMVRASRAPRGADPLASLYAFLVLRLFDDLLIARVDNGPARLTHARVARTGDAHDLVVIGHTQSESLDNRVAIVCHVFAQVAQWCA